jgi:ribosomal protein S18 acetylase RimI-like enzyme
VGFQGLMTAYDDFDLPENWATIGTFTRVGSDRRGIGRALLARTLAAARAAGIATIDATIRADNAAGLAFYSRQGFVDYARLEGVLLKDGRTVDRIRKRLDVT